MTPLEALEDLFNLVCEREHTNSEHNFWLKLYNKIEKSLKTLEIIKERFVWLENGELYCGRMSDIEVPIDEEIEGKEEMELLKEVLCKD